jgi:hypothetical protein
MPKYYYEIYNDGGEKEAAGTFDILIDPAITDGVAEAVVDRLSRQLNDTAMQYMREQCQLFVDQTFTAEEGPLEYTVTLHRLRACDPIPRDGCYVLPYIHDVIADSDYVVVRSTTRDNA